MIVEVAVGEKVTSEGSYAKGDFLAARMGINLEILALFPVVVDAAILQRRAFPEPDPESAITAQVMAPAEFVSVKVQYGSGFSEVIVAVESSGGMAKSPLATPA